MAELLALMKAAAPAAQPAAPAPVAATPAPVPQQYPQQLPPYAYPVMMPSYYGDYDQRPRQYDRDDNYGRGRRGYNNRSYASLPTHFHSLTHSVQSTVHSAHLHAPRMDPAHITHSAQSTEHSTHTYITASETSTELHTLHTARKLFHIISSSESARVPPTLAQSTEGLRVVSSVVSDEKSAKSAESPASGEPEKTHQAMVKDIQLVREKLKNSEILDAISAQPLPPSAEKISRVVQHKTKIQHRRKNLVCEYCKKKGHKRYYCPSRPNSDEKQRLTEEQNAFAQSLLTNPDVDPSEYKENIQEWVKEGERINATNPWRTDNPASHIERVRSTLGFWKAAGASTTVLSWLIYGIKARFDRKTIRRRAFKNTQSYETHKQFVHEEVVKHLKDGSLSVVTRRFAKVINPVKVEEGKKLRMCIDTRYPNSFLATPKFKNETIEVVLDHIVEPGDLMVTTDISKAYYAVPLDEESRPYFCFEHAGVVLCPKMLVFGMNEAPFFFNKIMRVVIKLARSLNIRMSSYFDDQIWFAATESEAKELVEKAKTILTKLGWLLNEKAKLDPSKRADHIGFEIDTTSMTVHVMKAKIEKIQEMLDKTVQEKGHTTLKELASLTGKLSATRTAISAAPTFTREMFNQQAEESARSWDDKPVKLRGEVLEEVKFWKEHLRELNERGRKILREAHKVTARSDASDQGWGMILQEGTEEIRVTGVLPEYWRQQSSTAREIYALSEGIREQKHNLKGKVIKAEVDSRASMFILQKGSSRTGEIHKQVKELWNMCTQAGIDLKVNWIPREENKRADLLSRLNLGTPKIVREAAERWAHENKHRISIDRVWSSNGRTDELAIVRPDENHIADAFAMARLDKAKVGIVHPNWPAQPWTHFTRRLGPYFVAHLIIGDLRLTICDFSRS